MGFYHYNAYRISFILDAITVQYTVRAMKYINCLSLRLFAEFV